MTELPVKLLAGLSDLWSFTGIQSVKYGGGHSGRISYPAAN